MKPPGRRVAIAAGILAVVVLGVAGWLSWPFLRFWYLFEPLGRNAQGYLEYRHRQTGIVMVSLPGGTFWMGAQAKDPKGQNYDPDAQENEGPIHEVTLTPFLIGKFEVTRAQWRKVMLKPVQRDPAEELDDEDRPVDNVSWDDVQGFNAKTGLRFPIEAEWEYACRGGTTSPIAGTGKLDDVGWYVKNSGSTTHPVGKKAANGFGLHDLHGNVWEWCEDVYNEDFYKKPESAEKDPIATSGSGLIIGGTVARGGSWRDISSRCRSAIRGWSPPAYAPSHLGFRAAWRW